MVVKGDVKVEHAGQTNPAKIGTKIHEGDVITTGTDSRAKIVMNDRNVIHVSPDSKMKIEKYTVDVGSGARNVEIKLEDGKVRNNVEQKYDNNASKFLIKTPTAVAGVRGTQFITSYNKLTQITEVVTLKGEVMLTSMGNKAGITPNTVYIKKGQSSSVTNTAPPAPPRIVPVNDLKNMDRDTSGGMMPGSSPVGGTGAANTPPPPARINDNADMDPGAIDKNPPIGVGPSKPPQPPAFTPPKPPTKNLVNDAIRNKTDKTRVKIELQQPGTATPNAVPGRLPTTPNGG